jgi:pyruvate,orthophosphate dikinase
MCLTIVINSFKIISVPAGFVITTETCSDFFKQEKHKLLEQFIDEYSKSIRELEKQTGKQFGVTLEKSRSGGGGFDTAPLLLSVRSGAAIPVPGMMHTVLNLGINDELVQVMARVSNNPRWAYDTYRRFIQMFGTVVLHVDTKLYDDILKMACNKRGVDDVSMLNAADLQQLVGDFKAVAEIPMDPWEQLQVAIESMFCSWYSPRAVKYRDINNLSSELGTAVVVQSMVYGNMNTRSGSGVVFTRHPATGDKEEYGHFLANAEGEEVLLRGKTADSALTTFKHDQPVVYDTLLHIETLLEKHYRDMQVTTQRTSDT